MSVEPPKISQHFQGDLYQNYCKISNSFKPKIKEIISLSIKNLMDLTNCLIQTHSSLINPKFSSLKIPKILDYEIDAWQNEILSTAIKNRREISRVMTDLKYMLSSVSGTEKLFMEINKYTDSLKDKWDIRKFEESGVKFRDQMLDLILITDPTIHGYLSSEEGFSKESEAINRRISEFSQQTKSFLEVRTHSGYQSTNYLMENVTKKAESIQLEIREEEIYFQGNYEDYGQYLRNNEEEVLEYREETDSRFLKTSYYKEYETKGKVNSSNLQRNKIISYGTGTLDKTAGKIGEDILCTYSSNESTKKDNKRGTIGIGINIRKKRSDSQKMGNTRSEPTFQKIKQSINLEKNTINKENREKYPPPPPSPKNNQNQLKYKKVVPKRVESIKQLPEEVDIPAEIDNRKIERIFTPKKSRPEKKPAKIVVTPMKEFKGNEALSKKLKEYSQVKANEVSPHSPIISLRSENNSAVKQKSKPKEKINYEIIQEQDTFDERLPSPPNELGNSKRKIHETQKSNSEMKEENSFIELGKDKKTDSLIMSEYSEYNDENLDRNSTVSFTAVPVEDISDNNIEDDIDDYRIALKKLRNKKKRKNKFVSNCSFEKRRIGANGSFKEDQLIVNKSSKVFKVKKLEDSSIQRVSDQKLPVFSQKHLKENIFSNPIIGDNQAPTTPRRATSDKFYQNNTPHKVDIQNGKFSARTPIKYSNQELKSEKSEEKIRKYINDTTFDIKKFLKDRDSEKIHLNCTGLQKIVLSNDGNYLIYGGEGLNVLDMTTDDFKIIRNDKKKSNIFIII